MNNIKNIFIENFYAISLYARQAAGTIVLFVIARYLSVYDYGLFSSYKAIAGFILTFACLGYNEYILVSSQNNQKLVRKKIALFLINALSIVLVAGFISIFTPLQMHIIFILVLLRSFFDGTFFTLVLPYFQATKKFNTIATINVIYSFLVIILTAISYLFKFTLTKFLVFSCLIGFINFIQCSLYIKVNYFRVILKPLYYCKLVDKTIFSYIGVIIAFILYSQIPSLFVSTCVPKNEAALFFSSFTVASIVNLLIVAQNQKIVPELIGAKIEKIKNLILCNFRFIMVINIIILITFLVIGKSLLFIIYGQQYYTNGYILLLIFTLSNISLALANIYGAYITASGNQHIKIHMQIEAIIISILTLIMLHKFGIYAAVLAYFLSATHIGVRYVIKTKQLIRQIENAKEKL